jgi:hypothetical protein
VSIANDALVVRRGRGLESRCLVWNLGRTPFALEPRSRIVLVRSDGEDRGFDPLPPGAAIVWDEAGDER